MKRPKLLVIVGPTASGKSALGVHMARYFSGAIISADSRQVYRGLTIGTGKIPKREMRDVRHYLLDVSTPTKRFSVSDFLRLSQRALLDIRKTGKLPIVVGGTGYFIDALAGRISVPEVPPNERLRAELEKKSPAQLFAVLRKKDPRRAATIEPHNKRRLIRALEIIAALGAVPATKTTPSTFDILWIGIRPSEAESEEKIHKRLLARMRQGMVAEAKRLHANGLSYRRMEELGLEYRSLARYLQGKITKDGMLAELERDIRRYAKKQMAYWKRNPDIKWVKSTQRKRIERLVRTWLTQ